MSSEEAICKPPPAHVSMSLRRKPECPLHTRQQTVDPDTLENVPVGKSKPQRLRGGGCCGECTDFACCLFIASARVSAAVASWGISELCFLAASNCDCDRYGDHWLHPTNFDGNCMCDDDNDSAGAAGTAGTAGTQGPRREMEMVQREIGTGVNYASNVPTFSSGGGGVGASGVSNGVGGGGGVGGVGASPVDGTGGGDDGYGATAIVEMEEGPGNDIGEYGAGIDDDSEDDGDDIDFDF